MNTRTSWTNKCATHILVLLIAMSFTGCVRNPNLVFVTKGGIKAQGNIFGVFKKHEQIELIAINPLELTDGQMHDLWVGFPLTNQITFAEITEDAIKKIGILRENPPSVPRTETGYSVCGYSFDFKGGRFDGFSANLYGWPPKDIIAFVKLGSRKSGSSLSLPCSVDDFEKVFGKADAVTRGFSW
jgi:hypothetical protein